MGSGSNIRIQNNWLHDSTVSIKSECNIDYGKRINLQERIETHFLEPNGADMK